LVCCLQQHMTKQLHVMNDVVTGYSPTVAASYKLSNKLIPGILPTSNGSTKNIEIPWIRMCFWTVFFD
jgi:hypothetical protein